MNSLRTANFPVPADTRQVHWN